MKKVKVNFNILSQIIFSLIIVIVLFIQVSKILQLKTLESSLFSISFILLLFSYLIIKLDNRYFSLLEISGILILLLALIACLSSGYEVSFDYLEKFIIFSSTIICFLYVSLIKPKKFLLKILFYSSYAQLLVFFIAFNLGIGSKTEFGELLTFGFTNPNFTGIWICFNILISLIGIIKFKSNLIIKLIVIFLIINNFYYIIFTGNRSSIIALSIFAFFMLINLFKKNKFLIAPIITITIPILILIVYYYFYGENLLSIFEFLESDGKGLDSRVLIWDEGLKTLMQYPILGNYYIVLNSLSYSQLHNAYLDVFVSYGVITGILFIIFMYFIFRNLSNSKRTNSNLLAYYGLIVMMIIMSFESFIVSGSTGLYIIICSMILCLDKGVIDVKK